MSKTRFSGFLCSVLLIAGLWVVSTPLSVQPVFGQEQIEQETETLDEVILKDGRRFVGHILEETDESIRMQFSVSGITTTKTWSKSDILEFHHDVITVDKKKASDSGKKADKKSTSSKSSARESTGNKRGRPVAVIPVEGVVGFDAYKDQIQYLWDDAVEAEAKTIILNFDCSSNLSMDVEKYRDFFESLKRDARSREIELVIWIKNATGMSIAYALMFETLYAHPDCVMGGGDVVDTSLKLMWSDEDVRAKMIAAWVGICRGMAEEGGHDAVLCEAMIRPELVLSLDYEGEIPHFFRDTEHKVVVDDDEEKALDINAKDADRWGVTKGTSRDLRDLMMKLEYREYYEVDIEAKERTEKWIDGWREAKDRTVPLIYAEIADGGGFTDARKRLGYQLRQWKRLRQLVIKWPPLQKVDQNLTIEMIDLQIEAIKKQMRELNSGGAAGKSRGSGNSGKGKGPGG